MPSDEISGVAVASEVDWDEGAYDDLPCHDHGRINCDECWTNTLADEYGNVVWILAGKPPRETPHASKRIFEATPASSPSCQRNSIGALSLGEGDGRRAIPRLDHPEPNAASWP